jgi:DivIVA domain-containing protein
MFGPGKDHRSGGMRPSGQAAAADGGLAGAPDDRHQHPVGLGELAPARPQHHDHDGTAGRRGRPRTGRDTIGPVKTVLEYTLGMLLVGGVLFLLVAFVFGRGEVLEPVPPDSVPVELPEDRPAGPDDVHRLRLPVVLRGYRMHEVDWVLDRLATELELRDAEIARLRADSDPGPAVAAPDPVPPFADAADGDLADDDLPDHDMSDEDVSDDELSDEELSEENLPDEDLPDGELADSRPSGTEPDAGSRS